MKLVEFLTKVVSDPDFGKQFCNDPEGTIRGADLSRRAIGALKSGDPKKVAFVICASGSWRDDKPVD